MTRSREATDQVTERTVVATPPRSVRRYLIRGVTPGRAAIAATLSPPAPLKLLIGTSASAGLRLEDPEVSRRHASLVVEDDGLRVVDHASTNGTFVGGVRVREAYVQAGQSLQVGASHIVVEAADVVDDVVDARDRFGGVIGTSRAMRRLYPLLDKAAASDAPLLIEGQTGTGKELVAEAIHEAGPRAAAPFVVVDLATIPRHLLEATLFGVASGAIAGIAPRPGLFEDARGGTLFVDEIAELEPALQPKLLRVIERGQLRRLGGREMITVDVRIIAATSRDLEREIEQGRFRDDLLYRLTALRIELPPLREREGDVETLARFFWERAANGAPFDRELLERVACHDWPGNVRELANRVTAALSFGVHAPARTAGRPETDPPQPPPARSATAALVQIVDAAIARGEPFPTAKQALIAAFEREYVGRVLALNDGNVARAARASGIARRSFQLVRSRQGR